LHDLYGGGGPILTAAPCFSPASMRMFAGEADGVLYGSSLGTCAAAACAAARLTDAMCCGSPSGVRPSDNPPRGTPESCF